MSIELASAVYSVLRDLRPYVTLVRPRLVIHAVKRQSVEVWS